MRSRAAGTAAEPRAIDGAHPQPQSVRVHQEIGADDVVQLLLRQVEGAGLQIMTRVFDSE